MKRFFIAIGCLFLGVGLFYEFMPIELFAAIQRLFGQDSGAMFFRVVSADRPDYFQIFFLFVGVAFLVIGMFKRPAKSRS